MNYFDNLKWAGAACLPNLAWRNKWKITVAVYNDDEQFGPRGPPVVHRKYFKIIMFFICIFMTVCILFLYFMPVGSVPHLFLKIFGL